MTRSYPNDLIGKSAFDLEIDLAYWKQYKPIDEDEEIHKNNEIRRISKRLERVINNQNRSFQT